MGDFLSMKLEKILLNPEETLVMAVDMENDFLKAHPGFSFHDAGTDLRAMQWKVIDGIIPLLMRSSSAKAHMVFIKSQYESGTFPTPYDKLCSGTPSTDFYLIGDIFPHANVFTKNKHDPFSNERLRAYIAEMRLNKIVTAGFTVTNCINSAVHSAIEIPGMEIIIPEDCVGYRPERAADARRILDSYAEKNARRIIVTDSQRNIEYVKCGEQDSNLRRH